MILVWRKLNLRWWNKRYVAWLPQAGVNVLLGLLVSNLSSTLGAAELIILLAAMYASATLVNVALGLHEDDRDLLRYVWARAIR